MSSPVGSEARLAADTLPQVPVFGDGDAPVSLCTGWSCLTRGAVGTLLVGDPVWEQNAHRTGLGSCAVPEPSLVSEICASPHGSAGDSLFPPMSSIPCVMTLPRRTYLLPSTLLLF